MTVKEKRALAGESGRCTTCITRETSGANKTCDRCLEVGAKSKAARSKAGTAKWCLDCIAYGFHRIGCSAVPT